MQHFSLHTHTIGFDGQNTVEEMVQQAQKLRWSKIGIANHFIVHPELKNAVFYTYACKGHYQNIYSETFEEAINKFVPLFQEIKRVEQKTRFPIYKGMEVDFFDTPEWEKGFYQAIRQLKPDYLIGSAHLVAYRGRLLNTHDMKKASVAEQTEILKIYWKNVRAAIEFGQFDFMAHLDLPAKVGLGYEKKWEKEEKETVAFLSACGGKTEVNTSALAKREEAYPSQRILKLLAKYQVPVLLSDDAHSVAQMGRHYKKAAELVKNAGITHTVYPVTIAQHLTQRIYTDWRFKRVR